MTPRTVDRMREMEDGTVASQANDSKFKVGSAACEC